MEKSKLGFLLILLSLAYFYLACGSKAPKTEEGSVIDVYEITPLADGGAYGISADSVWYFKEGEAIKVKKVEQFSTQSQTSLNINREKFYWTLWRKEIEKRKRLEAPNEEYEPYDPR